MQGEQEDLSDLSRSQRRDKPRHQENTNMGGKFHETMHMQYNLIHNGNKKWKDAIDLEIEQIKEYQVFKDYGKAVYDKDRIGNAPKEIQWKIQGKTCGRWASYQGTHGNCPFRSCPLEKSQTSNVSH